MRYASFQGTGPNCWDRGGILMLLRLIGQVGNATLLPPGYRTCPCDYRIRREVRMIDAFFWYTGLVFWILVAAGGISWLAVDASDRRITYRRQGL